MNNMQNDLEQLAATGIAQVNKEALKTYFINAYAPKLELVLDEAMTKCKTTKHMVDLFMTIEELYNKVRYTLGESRAKHHAIYRKENYTCIGDAIVDLRRQSKL